MAVEIKRIKMELNNIRKVKEKLNLNGTIFINRKLNKVYEEVKEIYEETVHIRSLKNLGTK